MVDDDATGSGGSVLLLQFAKEPVAGQVKTRMQPHLSPQAASELHEELVHWVCLGLCQSRLGDVELYYTGAAEHPVFRACQALGLKRLRPQRGKDLGQRMHSAMADGLQRYAHVILVGSDCPAIDSAYLRSAVEGLNHSDLVVGPAHDGGYVLIGARRIAGGLFEGVEWGTAAVLAQTLERSAGLGYSVEVLDTLFDIDRPEDLPHWRALRDGQ